MTAKRRIDNTIIVSDLDGTIVPNTGIISNANKEAIKRFESLGGVFTIATGRTPRRAMEFANVLSIKTPFVAGNGSVVFDPQTQKSIWSKCFLPECAQILTELINTFPHIGVVLIDTDDSYHIINDSKALQKYVKSGYIHKVTYEKRGCFPSNLRSGWMALNKEEFVEITLWIAHHRTPLLEFAISGECFIDILPGGVSKGACFEHLVCDIYKKKIADSVAIGDFPNDIEMIEAAGLGVAVSNAHEDVKKTAAMIVKSCDEDGVADLIDYLFASEQEE